MTTNEPMLAVNVTTFLHKSPERYQDINIETMISTINIEIISIIPIPSMFLVYLPI